MVERPLRYSLPFQCFLDTSFFQKLAQLKLEVLKLKKDAQKLHCKVNWGNAGEKSHLLFDGSSFDEKRPEELGEFELKGHLYNFNTLEEFKKLDKLKFLEERGNELRETGLSSIHDGVGFYMISFADLKKFTFVYWICMPTYQTENQEFVVESINEVENGNIFSEWFVKNPNLWVALTDDNKTIQPYRAENVTNSSVILIKDVGTLEKTPTTLTKNFLFLLQQNTAFDTNIPINFVRMDPKSNFQMNIKMTQPATSNLKYSGWERNMTGKLGPVAVDLSVLIDPVNLAAQSVDLNLKLMKWRIAPELDLDVIKKSKMLLLGAGTLGCYVARNLLAWGVNNMTLVDNSTVSMSNPVRQPLYEYSDIGKPKAEAAAERLKLIQPLLNVHGTTLKIPMIGHSISNLEAEKKDYETLKTLIATHDVIFLLMDSREARWLPTVLGNVENKIVINAALGFDSYLVMRHGNYGINRLGCYFCTDVMAPTDSLNDKTLDQMCTVTRPGVAPLAAASAVELCVSILQSEEKNGIASGNKGVLGEVPHQLRGFLSDFSIMKLETSAYESCSACSDPVVEACKEDDWQFVQNALSDPDFVDRLSGLEQVRKAVEDMADDFDWDEDDDHDM